MGNVRQYRNEGIIVLSRSSEYQTALMIGWVIKIEKGRDLDIVYLATGMGYSEHFARKIYVKGSNARRQVSTLKKGVYTLVWGDLPRYKYGEKNEMILNARAFWSAYVPTHFDRVELEKEQQMENIVELLNEQQEQENEIDFLSQFEKGENDE